MSLFENLHPIPADASKKKRSLLPLLTVVFLASYGLMTLLIVEQGETIQSQRNLIKVLLEDSRALWDGNAKAKADSQAPRLAPSTQTPSPQAPSNQVQANTAPSTQTKQDHSPVRSGKATKPENQLPQAQVPPLPASDLGDRRRVLIWL